MVKKKLLLLVDSAEYIRQNCYQHQLLETLKIEYDVSIFPLKGIVWNPFKKVSRYDCVLSVLKQRTLARHVDAVARFMNGHPLFIYDQDPWQAYIDDSPTLGCYELFLNKLNVCSLLLTTRWWTEFCAEKGLPASFVRMGMLPRYCDAGPDWVDRNVECGFQGTLHPHRKSFFDELSSSGTHVSVLPSGTYEEYLHTLHDIQIYIHTEDAPWQVGGQMIARNALWIKDTEVAARGCFAIRNWDEDYDAYDIGSIPTIFAFKNTSEVCDIIDSICSLSDSARQSKIDQAVASIKLRNDWFTVIEALKQSS